MRLHQILSFIHCICIWAKLYLLHHIQVSIEQKICDTSTIFTHYPRRKKTQNSMQQLFCAVSHINFYWNLIMCQMMCDSLRKLHFRCKICFLHNSSVCFMLICCSFLLFFMLMASTVLENFQCELNARSLKSNAAKYQSQIYPYSVARKCEMMCERRKTNVT